MDAAAEKKAKFLAQQAAAMNWRGATPMPAWSTWNPDAASVAERGAYSLSPELIQLATNRELAGTLGPQAGISPDGSWQILPISGDMGSIDVDGQSMPIARMPGTGSIGAYGIRRFFDTESGRAPETTWVKDRFGSVDDPNNIIKSLGFQDEPLLGYNIAPIANGYGPNEAGNKHPYSYYFDSDGKLVHRNTNQRGDVRPALGALMVAASALGMQGVGNAIANAAGNAAVGSGAAFGDAGMMYAGADAAAAGSLGGGASLGGGLGAGTATMGAGGAGSLLSPSALGLGQSFAPSLTGGLGGMVPPGAGYGTALTSFGPEIGASAYGSGALGLDAAMQAFANTASAGLPMAPDGTPPPPNPESLPAAPDPVPPPPNPYHPATYLNPQNLANLATSGAASSLLGPAASLAGGLAGGLGGGAGGGGGSGGGGGGMDPRLDPFIYGQGGLFERSQNLLGGAAPHGWQLGADTISRGVGLMGTPVAGNGFDKFQIGQDRAQPNTQVAGNGYWSVPRTDPGNLTGTVNLNSPNTPTNPYAMGILSDMQRRTGDVINKGLLAARSNAVGVGGLGGSRQGVAEAEAITRGADDFAGRWFGFMGSLYDSDQNRALQQYGMDQGFAAGQRGQDLQRTSLDMNFFQGQRGQDQMTRGQDLDVWNSANNRDLQRYGLQTGFYGQQRGQDASLVGMGSNLIGQGQQQQWMPLQSASDIFKPFSGLQSAGGGGGSDKFNWQGALGGLLSGASFGRQMNWW